MKNTKSPRRTTKKPLPKKAASQKRAVAVSKVAPHKRGLAHHSHSGKVLSKHHTSYPVIAFLLLLVGVFLVAFTFRAAAEDIAVVATAQGPLPPAAAVITTPANGATFTTKPVQVAGTCPTGHYIVKLYRNGLFSGSALCSSTGTFTISTDLFIGTNELKAVIVNGLDNEGPSSPAVSVMYQPPAKVTANAVGVTSSPVPQLSITSAVSFASGKPTAQLEWDIELIGGQAPYAINVDWGDGTNQVISRNEVGKFKVSHAYERPGGENGVYIVNIKASDATDQEATLQIFAIVSMPLAMVNTQENPADKAPTIGSIIGSFVLSWPLYVTAVLMALAFWLGERREFEILHHAGRIRKL